MFSFSTSKSVVLPTEGHMPQPNALDNIVRVSVAFDIAVCIICFTQERLDHWLALEDDLPQTSTSRMHILNINRAPLADWLDYVEEEIHHVTLLSGAYTELQADRLATAYVQLLVEAVPEGLVVLA